MSPQPSPKGTVDRTRVRPRVRRGLVAFAPNPDEVQIQAGEFTGPVFHVTDDDAAGALGGFLKLLDGSRTEAEILATLPAPQRKSFREFLAYLEESDLLETIESDRHQTPVEPMEPWSEALATFHLTTPDPVGHFNAMRRARILIVGAGRLAERLAEGLARLGAGTVRIWDTSAARAEALADRVAGAWPRTKVEAVDGDRKRLPDQLPGHTWVVVAQDRASPALFDAVNAAALRHGFPWTLAYVDGYDAYAGPTFVPHQTACHTCLRIRMRGNVVGERLHQRYLQHLSTANGSAPPGLPPIGAADWIAGVVLLDAPSLVKSGTGATAGQVVAVNLLAFSTEVETVLRLPRCPSCGKLARGHAMQQTHASITNLIGFLQGRRGPARKR